MFGHDVLSRFGSELSSRVIRVEAKGKHPSIYYGQADLYTIGGLAHDYRYSFSKRTVTIILYNESLGHDNSTYKVFIAPTLHQVQHRVWYDISTLYQSDAAYTFKTSFVAVVTQRSYSIRLHLTPIHQPYAALFLLGLFLFLLSPERVTMSHVDPRVTRASIAFCRWGLRGIGSVLVLSGCQSSEVAVASALVALLLGKLRRSPGRVGVLVGAGGVAVESPSRQSLEGLESTSGEVVVVGGVVGGEEGRVPRLLSQEEYVREGRVETERAVNQLHHYCRSSRGFTDFVKISRLSPDRLAAFFSQGRHLSFADLYSYHKDIGAL